MTAEDIAEVNPDLVVRDEKGEIYTVWVLAVASRVAVILTGIETRLKK